MLLRGLPALGCTGVSSRVTRECRNLLGFRLNLCFVKDARGPVYPYYHLLNPELGTEVPMLMPAVLHQHLQQTKCEGGDCGKDTELFCGSAKRECRWAGMGCRAVLGIEEAWVQGTWEFPFLSHIILLSFSPVSWREMVALDSRLSFIQANTGTEDFSWRLQKEKTGSSPTLRSYHLSNATSKSSFSDWKRRCSSNTYFPTDSYVLGRKLPPCLLLPSQGASLISVQQVMPAELSHGALL